MSLLSNNNLILLPCTQVGRRCWCGSVTGSMAAWICRASFDSWSQWAPAVQHQQYRWISCWSFLQATPQQLRGRYSRTRKWSRKRTWRWMQRRRQRTLVWAACADHLEERAKISSRQCSCCRHQPYWIHILWTCTYWTASSTPMLLSWVNTSLFIIDVTSAGTDPSTLSFPNFYFFYYEQ